MSWGVRCADDDVAIDFVRQLAREVSQRMQKLKIVASKTTLKLWRAIADARARRRNIRKDTARATF